MDAVEQFNRLKDAKESADKALVAAQTRVTDLKEERALKLQALKKLGVDDPKKIPDILESIEREAQDMVAAIDKEIPDEFRSDD